MACCDCCCPNPEECCKSQGENGICCLPEKCCGTAEAPECCSPSEFCCDEVCCPEGYVCCEGVCCGEGEQCVDGECSLSVCEGPCTTTDDCDPGCVCTLAGGSTWDQGSYPTAEDACAAEDCGPEYECIATDIGGFWDTECFGCTDNPLP